MKLRLIFVYAILLGFFYFVSNQTGTTTLQPPGFFGGLCDGMISVFAAIIHYTYSVTIEIWRINNDGVSYKFGFLIGFILQIIFFWQLFFAKRE